MHEPGIAEQVIPAPEGRNHLGSLSALYYSIKEQEEQAEKISASLVAAEPTSSPIQPQATSRSDPSVKEGAQSIQVAKRKEQINTRGPIEGEQYRSARSMERKRPQNIEEPPLRDRDSSRHTPLNATPMASSTGQQHELTCYPHQAIGGVFSGDLSQVIGCWWRAG